MRLFYDTSSLSPFPLIYNLYIFLYSSLTVMTSGTTCIPDSNFTENWGLVYMIYQVFYTPLCIPIVISGNKHYPLTK